MRIDRDQEKLAPPPGVSPRMQSLNPQITICMIRIGQEDIFTVSCSSFIVTGREIHLGEKISVHREVSLRGKLNPDTVY